MRGTSSSEKAVRRRAASPRARRLVERPEQCHQRGALAQARDARVVGQLHAEQQVGGREQRRAIGLDPRARRLVIRVAVARRRARPDLDAHLEARLRERPCAVGYQRDAVLPGEPLLRNGDDHASLPAYGRDTIGDGTGRAQG